MGKLLITNIYAEDDLAIRQKRFSQALANYFIRQTENMMAKEEGVEDGESSSLCEAIG